MQDLTGDNGFKCPHCGEDLGEWEPSEADRTPVDSRFDRINAQLRETAREVAHKQLESDYHACKSRTAELEVELLGARAETKQVKIENEKLKLALKKLRAR